MHTKNKNIYDIKQKVDNFKKKVNKRDETMIPTLSSASPAKDAPSQ